ncbi:MAG: hypothetical protein ACRDT8_13565 [Micromonosporaceae bacterium]
MLDTSTKDPGVTDPGFSARGGVAYVDVDATAGDRAFVIHKYATWPFARLRICDEKIVISSLFGKVFVTHRNFVSISRFRAIPVLADGFKFVMGQDAAVVFWALRVSKVRDELQRRGWKVDRPRR